MEVRFVAGFGSIVRALEASCAFWGDGPGIVLAKAASNDWTTDDLAGVQAVVLWPRSQAAESCFGTTTWPAELPTPQAWIELCVPPYGFIAPWCWQGPDVRTVDVRQSQDRAGRRAWRSGDAPVRGNETEDLVEPLH